MPENFQQAAAAWAKRCVEHGEEIDRLKKALEAILDISHDSMYPAWQALQNIAATASKALEK